MSVPALSSHQVTVVTNKVNRLLTLSRVCSEELDFVILVALAANNQSPSTPVTSVVPSLSSHRKYLSRVPLVTRLLPLSITVSRDPKAEIQSRQQVEPRGLLLDISHVR